MSKYNVNFDDNSSPPFDKNPQSLVKKKSSVMDEEVQNLSSIESSVGGEESDEELEDCNEDEAKDVPIEDSDDLVLSDPQGNTLTGRFMLNWNKRHKYLLHVIAQVAHILSPNPVVQEFVKNCEVAAGKNAAEHLIKKWIVPTNLVGNERDEKEASMIDLFHQEFGTIVSLICKNFSLFHLILLLLFRFISKSHRYA